MQGVLEGSTLIGTGEVEYVENGDSLFGSSDLGAWRLKVRMDCDKGIPTSQLPWAFPLLPKTLQTIPQKGEGVFIVTGKINTPNSQRYYVGPIIAQPQDQTHSDYGLGGRGRASSLLSGRKPATENPQTSIWSQKQITNGSFPEMKDVALVGRGQEDIVLKYREQSKGETSEIDLRAGIRLKPSTNTVKFLNGNVAFNSNDPAYVQVKHSTTGLAGLKSGEGDADPEKYESTNARRANAVVNIVADKINLISHQDSNSFGSLIKDQDSLVKDGELDQIMSLMHRSVYGDELVTLLKKIVEALANHTHPISMLPPTQLGTSLENIIDYDYEKILSPNVRIS